MSSEFNIENSNIYYTHKGILKNLDQHIQYVSNLDDKIKESLKWYTKDNYLEFNKKLRRGENLTGTFLMHLNNIDKAFRESPVLNFNLMVYRGIKEEIEFVTDKAVLSTSIDINSTIEFSNCCTLHINVTPGNKILPLWNISHKPKEFEILLNRDQLLLNTLVKNDKDKKIFFCSMAPTTSKLINSETISELESENNKEEDKMYRNIKESIKDTLSDSEMLELEEIDISTIDKLKNAIKYEFRIRASKVGLSEEIPEKLIKELVGELWNKND